MVDVLIIKKNYYQLITTSLHCSNNDNLINNQIHGNDQRQYAATPHIHKSITTFCNIDGKYRNMGRSLTECSY